MASKALKQTAFHDVQDQLGPEWTDWEGWSWADHFGDPQAEHEATRNASNLWDESPLRKWDMKGPDAMALADVLFTNDMAALEVGQVRYGAICDEDGMMIMDGTIFKHADDHCFSITSYDSDLEWFRKVASDRGMKVEIEDMTADMPHLQVQGPKSREILAPITVGVDLGELRYFRFAEDCKVGGVPCLISRTGYSGELGFELYCKPDDAAELWDAVLAAGRPQGMLPIGLSAIETIRIESGLLFPDIDYFPHKTDPYEVRLDKMVKLDKPVDFVGKEALAKIAADGGTARLLTTLKIEGDETPEYGATVTKDGNEVGIVRSPAKSPTFDEQIAMAIVDRDLNDEGTEVEVALGEGTVKATVASFPIYDPEKKRPRS